MIYAILGLLFLLADQFLKFWTVGHVELNANPGIRVLPFLNLTYVKNEGIAFGMFSNVSFLRWILLGLLVMFTVFIVLGIARGFLRTGLARFSGAMLLSGLLGNGVDRAIYGYVVDMLEPRLGSLTLPIFNIADFLAVVFGILFCISLLTGGIGAPEEDFDDEDEEEEEEEDEDDEEDGTVFYSVKCPGCGSELTVDEDILDEGEFECPECGEVIDFETAEVSEVEFEDEDEEE